MYLAKCGVALDVFPGGLVQKCVCDLHDDGSFANLAV
jgi:hypothetical protein